MYGNEYNDPIQRQARGIQAGDFLPGGVSTRGVWNPGETPEVGGFDGGGGGFSLRGSDPRLNTMDRIDRERYEGEAEARDYYLNAQQNPSTIWDAPKPWRRSEQMPTLSRPRPVDTQGDWSGFFNKPINPRTGGAFSGLAGRW